MHWSRSSLDSGQLDCGAGKEVVSLAKLIMNILVNETTTSTSYEPETLHEPETLN